MKSTLSPTPLVKQLAIRLSPQAGKSLVIPLAGEGLTQWEHTMAEILKRNKALAVNPLKASQPVGASLAFLGINKAIPMLHGSQGCTAFGKVFFVRHFRAPIPLHTTA